MTDSHRQTAYDAFARARKAYFELPPAERAAATVPEFVDFLEDQIKGSEEARKRATTGGVTFLAAATPTQATKPTEAAITKS